MKTTQWIAQWVVVVLVGFALAAGGCSSPKGTTDNEEEQLIMPGNNNQPGTNQGDDAVVAPDDADEFDEDLGDDPEEDVLVPEDDVEGPPDNDVVTPPDVPVQPGDCEDKDGDGYGTNCYLGADCDDTNPHFDVYCPNCENDQVEGCPCTIDGLAEVCYEGDPSTVGIGVCQLGQRFCQAGFWTACIGQIVPTAEECNEYDDDCDGQVDEGVLSPCGNCDPFCDTLEAGPGTPYPFEPTEENSSGVGTNLDGFLVLDSDQLNLSFIWIANSGEATVSKLDTDTGDELGRYKTCGSPSRTAVDLLGNVYVGCRSDGGVVKIAIDEALCIDKNNNGVIDTSHDSSVLPYGQDECVLYTAYPGGSCARALGVDADNNPWVGDWSGQHLKKLDADTGQPLQTIGIGCSPYGLVIGGDGIIWVSGRGCNQLIRVDPDNGAVTKYNPPQGNLYGITVGPKGNVWLGHYSNHGVSRFNPNTNQFDWITANVGSSCPRGMAGSTAGYMYSGLGCGGDHAVLKIDIETLQTWKVDIGPGSKTTVGVAMDSKGHLWAVNQSSSSASKINTVNDQVVGEYPVGSSPYTYSDMTGYALHNFTAPQGNYNTVFGGWEEIRVKWKAIYVDAEYPDENAFIKLEVRTALSEQALENTPWQGLYGPYPPDFFPLDLTQVPAMDGKLLQVRVWLFSADKMSTPIIKSIQAKFAND